METRLPNKHWFDIMQLLVGHEEPHRLWWFYYTESRDRHGNPILRTGSLWFSPIVQSPDGNWYIKVSPYKRTVEAFGHGIENDWPWLGTRIYIAAEFPWRYQAKHGLFQSKRQALKALHEYEALLIKHDFDERAADKEYDELRGGTKSAQEARVGGTAKQVDDFDTNTPAQGEFDGNKGE